MTGSIFSLLAVASPIVYAIQTHMGEIPSTPESYRKYMFEMSAEGLLCPLQRELPAVIGLVTIACWSICFLALTVRGRDVGETALTVSLAPQFVSYAGFTVIILESYDVATGLGRHGAFSGMLIGIYQLLFPFGSFLIFLLQSKVPYFWLHWSRMTLLLALAGQLIGAAAYTWGSMQATGDVPPYVVPLLLGGRAAAGFCFGCIHNLNVMNIQHIAPVKDRAEYIGNLYLANMVGIGMGPAISAMGYFTDNCPTRSRRFGEAGLLHMALVLVALVTVFTVFPSLDSSPDVESMSPRSHNPSSDDFKNGKEKDNKDDLTDTNRYCVIFGGLLMTLGRSFVVASLEAASSMLLQLEYNWSKGTIGVCIGLTFLMSIPLKIFNAKIKERVSEITSVRALALVAAFASVLLMARFSRIDYFGIQGISLLLADSILFPSLYLADSISISIMFDHVFPHGSFLDANFLVLAQSVIVNATGRFLGPWFARSVLEAGGQDEYANFQLAITIGFLLIFEVLVRPHMTKPKSAS